MYKFLSNVGDQMGVDKSNYKYQCSYMWVVILQSSVLVSFAGILLVVNFTAFDVSIMGSFFTGIEQTNKNQTLGFLALIFISALNTRLVCIIFESQIDRLLTSLERRAGFFLDPIEQIIRKMVDPIMQKFTGMIDKLMTRFCKEISNDENNK